MKATASKSISYTFGERQAAGIDNVTVYLTVDVPNPLTGESAPATVPTTVQLPSSGWTDDDVLKALQAQFPKFDVQWEQPAADLTPLPE